MQHELPGLPRADLGQAADKTFELVVRHREDHQLAAADDLCGVEDGHAGQDRLDAFGIGALRDPHERVPCSAERCAEHRPDPAGADDPDTETAVAAHARSSPGSRTTV